MNRLMGSRTSTTRMIRSNDARVRSQEGRDGAERVLSLRGKRAEGREKRREYESIVIIITTSVRRQRPPSYVPDVVAGGAVFEH